MINLEINTFLAAILLLLVLAITISAAIFYNGMQTYRAQNIELSASLAHCSKSLTDLETVADELEGTMHKLREETLPPIEIEPQIVVQNATPPEEKRPKYAHRLLITHFNDVSHTVFHISNDDDVIPHEIWAAIKWLNGNESNSYTLDYTDPGTARRTLSILLRGSVCSLTYTRDDNTFYQ